MPIVAAIAVPHPPIILPPVGRGEEKKIQSTIDAYSEAARFVAQAKPEALVVASPHTELYTDWFHLSPGHGAEGHFASFGAPELCVAARYDEPLAAAIEAEAQTAHIAAGREGQRHPALDHGTMIPLWFLQKQGLRIPIVRIGLSGFSFAEHYRLGQCIAAAAKDKRVAFVASADLSHRLREDGPYGFAPEGPVLDSAITAALAHGDFSALLGIDPALAEKGAECGLRSLLMMAGALDGRAVFAKLLCYQGTFGVGYAVATFVPGAPDSRRRFLPAAEG